MYGRIGSALPSLRCTLYAIKSVLCGHPKRESPPACNGNISWIPVTKFPNSPTSGKNVHIQIIIKSGPSGDTMWVDVNKTKFSVEQCNARKSGTVRGITILVRFMTTQLGHSSCQLKYLKFHIVLCETQGCLNVFLRRLIRVLYNVKTEVRSYQ